MEIKDFAKEVVAVVERKMEGAEVTSHEIEKNNGLVLTGIVIKEGDARIAPNIYINSHYEKGLSPEETAEKVVQMYNENKESGISLNVVDSFLSFEEIKDKIYFTLVNTTRNEERFKNVPHTDVEDLSYVYRVLVVNDKDKGVASITILQNHMDMWGVTLEEIHEVAKENTPRLFPADVRDMNSILREMLGADGMPEEMIEMMCGPADQQMYVISNTEKVNGAVAMLYDGVLDELAAKLDSNLFILPSSIHEVIAISDKLGTATELKEMVGEVNETQVAPEEQLSGNVYHYDRATGNVTLAVASAVA